MAEATDLKNQMNQLIRGYWVTQAIYVVAELGVADLLADGPKAPAELAETTGANTELLYRVLRALASLGIFSEDAGRTVPADTTRGHLAKRAWRTAGVRTTARERPLSILGKTTGGRSVGADRIR